MILKKINYKEFSPEDQKNNYWELGGLVLGATNLIVGKNASGKTRTLNLMQGLALIINSTRNVQNSYFEAVFVMDDKKELKYNLEISLGKITKELIVVDGEIQADVAVLPELINMSFSFSELRNGANVLIFPDLQSGNISYKLMKSIGQAE
ncbi:MAG: hypothetical protein HYT94_04550, partial [Parcubacteria group bacterium]|nr:hypothetical protein [Parcubacteria group bacterium]